MTQTPFSPLNSTDMKITFNQNNLNMTMPQQSRYSSAIATPKISSFLKLVRVSPPNVKEKENAESSERRYVSNNYSENSSTPSALK